MQPGNDLRRALEANAEKADRSTDWPEESWGLLHRSDVLRWGIVAEDGGLGLDPASYLAAQETLAAGCLTTTFILSQREAAVRMIARYAEPKVRQRILMEQIESGGYATVGISQLTTSRRYSKPSLVAEPVGPDGAGGFRLTGEMPWVTGADRAETIVTAAALADGRQVALRLPPNRPGVTIGPSMDLLALLGSRTAAVRCDDVFLEPDLLLAGPEAGLFGEGTGGGPETSALALGLARASVQFLHAHAERRPEVIGPAARLANDLAARREELHRLAEGASDRDAVHEMRARCSALALRATQAALLAAKGSGFVSPHPAGRWARQALFFLVWSCPALATAGLFDELTGADHE
jgi:butyryl-CoA dehydrogenase